MAEDLEHTLKKVACLAADAARHHTLSSFRVPVEISNKSASSFDPVTVADRAAERAIRDVIAHHRPQDSIIGEELDQRRSSGTLVWVIDPIDGTRGYIAGTPVWGTLIAVGEQTDDVPRPIAGLVDQPYIGERFWGGFGHASLTTRTGEIAITTSSRRLNDAILFTTFPEVGTSNERQGFEAVAKRAKLTRYGMDCYAYALLAAGHVDLVVEAGLHPYDIQAPLALIEAAGGVVTNWRGGPGYGGGQIVAAANAHLHREALEVLAPYCADGKGPLPGV